MGEISSPAATTKDTSRRASRCRIRFVDTVVGTALAVILLAGTSVVVGDYSKRAQTLHENLESRYGVEDISRDTRTPWSQIKVTHDGTTRSCPAIGASTDELLCGDIAPVANS